jgi:hypothetical protein
MNTTLTANRDLAAPAFLKNETVRCLIDGLSVNGYQKLLSAGVFEKTSIRGRVTRESVERCLGRKVTNQMYLDAAALVAQRKEMRPRAKNHRNHDSDY